MLVTSLERKRHMADAEEIDPEMDEEVVDGEAEEGGAEGAAKKKKKARRFAC